MYKLKYSLLLPIAMMYAASICAMTTTPTQLGRRAAEEKIAELVIKEREAREKTLSPCKAYGDLDRMGWHDAEEKLPKIKSESPECISPYNGYLSAQIELLEEENRQANNLFWDKDHAERKASKNRIQIEYLKERQAWLK